METALEARFRNGVRQLGGICEKLAPIRKGLPDRLVLLPGGRIYLVEMKAPDGRISPAQGLLHSRMAAVGTNVVVLSSEDEVESWLADRRLDPRRRSSVVHRPLLGGRSGEPITDIIRAV